MGQRRVAIRILGVASTTHGFAFALTEGGDRLLDWGSRKTASVTAVLAHLDALVERTRPLFVACEVERNEKKSPRAQLFNYALKSVCSDRDIMILCVERKLGEDGSHPVPTSHDIASAAVGLFPILADKLPKQRRLWEGADDRIGVLLAVAASAAGWKHFRFNARRWNASTSTDVRHELRP